MSEWDSESLRQTDEELSRIYRERASELPPKELDDAILAAARREVHSRPRLTTSPFSSTWAVPLSLAAVLVLSVTVTLMMTEHKSDVDYLPARVSDVAAPKAPETPTYLIEPNEAPSAGAKSTPLQLDQHESRRRKSNEPLRQEANDLGSLESLSGKLGKDAPAKADSSLRDDSIQDKTQPGEAFPGVQSQPEAAGAPAAAPESQAPMPAERESGLREEKKQVAPAPMRKMEQSKEADEVQDLAPQAWLEYIIKLRSLSKWDEANAGLARFRQHYPDYPLPDALK